VDLLHNFVKKEWIKELDSLKKSKVKNINILNEQELNTLDYELAIENDKRTYFEYYWSLLKKKHLILFTFIPMTDYNLLCIKISLFLISFSLSFTINAFFFDDETMHKIYVNKGTLNFINQIAQIFYSTLICTVINTALRILSLSENKILEIKKEKTLSIALNKSELIKKLFRIKYIISYILIVLLLLFFWYFISCFCVVYNNTQVLLIKDTLIGFGLSLVYPFGLNLLPGFFRIPSLRALNKNKKCLYKLSLFVALI
jgi:hypothetical protein